MFRVNLTNGKGYLKYDHNSVLNEEDIIYLPECDAGASAAPIKFDFTTTSKKALSFKKLYKAIRDMYPNNKDKVPVVVIEVYNIVPFKIFGITLFKRTIYAHTYMLNMCLPAGSRPKRITNNTVTYIKVSRYVKS